MMRVRRQLCAVADAANDEDGDAAATAVAVISAYITGNDVAQSMTRQCATLLRYIACHDLSVRVCA